MRLLIKLITRDLATERDPGNPKLLLASPPHTRYSSLGELMACSLLELQGDATTSLTKQALKSWTLGERRGDPRAMLVKIHLHQPSSPSTPWVIASTPRYGKI